MIKDPRHRAQLFGAADSNLRLVRRSLGVQVSARDSTIRISGEASSVNRAAVVFEALQDRIGRGEILAPEAVADLLAEHDHHPVEQGALDVYTPSMVVAPRSDGQRSYLKSIQEHDLTLCVGPAGTGKTYLAVAVAVSMLKARMIKRIVLVRPAVEAGEKLGFLPGDLQAKVNPYLRPLIDAMNDMMSYDQVRRFMETDVVEVVPLAFMRGRTLNHAAIILDEAQNTTVPQMLMFLTRLGQDSKMIVTGDDSQVDLPRGEISGMWDAVQRLQGIPGIAIIRLQPGDIVRHPLVHRVVAAYGDSRNGGQ